MDAINQIAHRYQIPVIEDAAQSLGATYKGKKSGNLSTIACTSFFPSKPLGCYGDGGACFTNDDDLANDMRQIRVHGQNKRYHHRLLGMNSRLDTIQAAILLAKLQVFEEEVRNRQLIGQQYHELLQNHVKPMRVLPDNTCVFAQYTVQISNRDKVCEYLKSVNIPTAIHYPIPLHLQPVFANKAIASSLTKAENAAQSVMSLPMHPYLSSDEQSYIVENLCKALQQ
jgi:UDP-2-acetamido-2-deoxy-ribo-hexuluronate aminotransferase